MLKSVPINASPIQKNSTTRLALEISSDQHTNNKSLTQLLFSVKIFKLFSFN